MVEYRSRDEVLRGARAFNSGFASAAGVVNVVTKRAGSTTVTTLHLRGNEVGQYMGHVCGGSQFGGNNQFGMRINVAGGQVRNAIDGYKGSRQLVAGAFDWHVTDKLTLKLDAEDVRRDAVEQASVSLNAAVNNVITLPSVPDPTKLLSGKWALTTGDIVNDQARADYQINDDWAAMVEVGRAETNRRRRESSQVQNYNVLTGAGTLRVALTRGQAYVNESARTELSGRFLTWFLDHEITFGGMKNHRYQNGPSQQVVNIPQNLYNPVEVADPILTSVITFIPEDINDKGLYVFDRIRIGTQWQMQLGVRHTDYTNASPTTIYQVKSNTPAYGLVWKPRQDTSLYLSYIEGLEEGGNAPLSTNNPGQVLPPGISKQKEAGVRTEAFSGLSLTGAYFTIDRASAYTNTDNFFVLDGRTTYKGFEYSASGEMGSQLSIYFSGMFLDAKQERAQNTALLGKAPDNTPKQTHSLFGEYRPSWAPGFGVNAGAYYISKRFINNLEQGSIPAYTIFNAGARYSTKIAQHATTFQLYVENVADKRYWSAAGGGILAVGMPRTVKFSMKVDL